jgi:hypothetical protein
MNDKRTGMGGLFLLKRTAPLPSETKSETTSSPEPLTREMPQQRDFAPQEISPKNNQKAPKPLRDRCTLYLEPEVNRQLELVARIERKQRSEVVTEILQNHLPRYRINREGE